MSAPIGIVLAAATSVAVATGVIRAFALRRGIMDVPNERSSHVVPTPRGGGVPIVIAILVAVVAAALRGNLQPLHAVGIGGGVIAVAVIGWLDDIGRLRTTGVLTRAGVHFLAAGWSVYWLGGFDSLDFGGFSIALPYVGAPLAMFGVVWATNLYNFMDGIDGIAGVQALVGGLVAGSVLWISGATGLAVVLLCVAGAAIGFLFWNWNPARVFLGDVGSGALGFTFATVAIAAENASRFPAIAFAMIFGVFITDATATLIRRLLRGERVYQAHRTHAYQRLVGAGWSHAEVALAVGVLSVVLSLLAVLAWRSLDLTPYALLMAAVLLTFTYGYVERRAPAESSKPITAP